QILAYTIVLVASTLAVAPLAGLGPLYTVSAAALGAIFLFGAERLRRVPNVPHAQQLFRYSIAYLFVLFLMMCLDALARVARAAQRRADRGRGDARPRRPPADHDPARFASHCAPGPRPSSAAKPVKWVEARPVNRLGLKW